MAERLDKARTIRIGADRLRQLSAIEVNPEAAREMRRIAPETDQSATDLERSFVNRPPKTPSDQVASVGAKAPSSHKNLTRAGRIACAINP